MLRSVVVRIWSLWTSLEEFPLVTPLSLILTILIIALYVSICYVALYLCKDAL